MLIATIIGHIGGDAEVKNSNGKEFVTFRVAHTDKWTDDKGQQHESTIWVDVIMNQKTAVFDYLKKGQQVYVTGSAATRVYSSAKDRCMKAGLTINARSVELIGGKGDEVPSVLYSAEDGTQVDVKKFYNAATLVRDETKPEFVPLVSRSQARFVADRLGWVYPYVEEQEQK